MILIEVLILTQPFKIILHLDHLSLFRFCPSGPDKRCQRPKERLVDGLYPRWRQPLHNVERGAWIWSWSQSHHQGAVSVRPRPFIPTCTQTSERSSCSWVHGLDGWEELCQKSWHAEWINLWLPVHLSRTRLCPKVKQIFQVLLLGHDLQV